MYSINIDPWPLARPFSSILTEIIFHVLRLAFPNRKPLHFHVVHVMVDALPSASSTPWDCQCEPPSGPPGPFNHPWARRTAHGAPEVCRRHGSPRIPLDHRPRTRRDSSGGGRRRSRSQRVAVARGAAGGGAAPSFGSHVHGGDWRFHLFPSGHRTTAQTDLSEGSC